MALPSHGGNVRLKNEGSVKIDMSFRVLCVKSLIGFFVDVRNLFLPAAKPTGLVEADSSSSSFFLATNEQRPKQPKQTWFHM